MKAFTTIMVESLAQLLHDNNLGEYPPDDGLFTGIAPAIMLKKMPQSPDEVISLNPYGNDDSPNRPMGTVSVQIRARGTTDPMSCDDILDPIFDLLHGARYLVLVPGQPGFSLVSRKSSVSMGMDANGRWERADNYAFFGTRNTPNLKTN